MSKAAASAKISRPTWMGVEDGSRETLSYNYSAVERVLQWAPGSVEAILGGGEPSPMRPPPTADSALRRAELAIRRIEDVLDFPGLDKSMRLDTIRGIVVNYRLKAPRPAGVDVAQPDDGDERRFGAG